RVARNHLALAYREQGRYAEAEALWQALLAEQPDKVAFWADLADLYLRQGRPADAEAVIRRLETLPEGGDAAALLRARVHLGRREFAAARALLEPLAAADPQALAPRVVLSYAYLQE